MLAILTAKTKQGTVRGKPAWNRAISVFRGVPFAEPPTGENRWRAPKPAKSWSGVRDCFDYGPIPYQAHEETRTDVLVTGIRTFRHPLSEDCLYLNIWTPAESESDNLPVAVYIHGGGFHSDYAFLNKHDGEAYAKRGCVFVTVSYRLGVFGFLAHPQLEQEGPGVGNYGILDQIAALRWVRENIRGFGGNPDCVTVIGFSGGAASVEYLCASPLAKGLFQRAIMQSGGGFRPVFSSWAVSKRAAMSLGDAYLRYMNVRTIAEARRLDSDIILNGFTGMNRIPLFAGEEIGVDGVHYFRFTPSLGGDVLPEDPISVFLKGGHPDIDYLVGEAAGEGVRTVVADVAWCRNQNALGRRPTYQYFFRRVPPGASGAFHSCEQEYMFQTLLKSLEWHYTGTDFDISNDMADYFCNFIKTGDPNGPGLAAWTPHTADSPRAMQFDEERKMIDVPLTDAMETTIGKLMHNEILFGLNDKS